MTREEKDRRTCLTCKEAQCVGYPCKLIDTAPKRNVRTYCIAGETHTVSEWADIYGVSKRTLYAYIERYNGDISKAIERTAKRQKKISKKFTAFGFSFTLRGWSNVCNVDPEILFKRLLYMPPEKALAEAEGKVL